MNLGKSIKDLRKEKGWSQEELSSRAGITQAALSQIENGKRPGIQTLKKLSKALHIPVSLIYIGGMEKEDVPKKKQALYDQLFPVIQNMVAQIVKSD